MSYELTDASLKIDACDLFMLCVKSLKRVFSITFEILFFFALYFDITLAWKLVCLALCVIFVT